MTVEIHTHSPVVQSLLDAQSRSFTAGTNPSASLDNMSAYGTSLIGCESRYLLPADWLQAIKVALEWEDLTYNVLVRLCL